MNGRNVTEPSDAAYWTGRLAMGLAHVIGRKDVTYAREPLEAYLRSSAPPPVREMIQAELKR